MKTSALVVPILFLVALVGRTASAAGTLGTTDATKLARCTQRYEVDGAPVQAGIVPDKTEVVAGEPIILTLYIKNCGTKAIELPRFSPRGQPDPTFEIKAEDENGAAVEPVQNSNHGGLGWTTELKQGEVFTQSIFLHDHLTPLEPGRYEVTCEWHSEPFGDEFVRVKSVIELTVEPADSQALGRTIARFGRLVPEAEKEDLVTATKALAAIDDDRTVPHLLKSIGRGDYQNSIPAITALAKYPSPELVQALKGPLHDKKDNAVRSAAASALGSFKYPESVTLLLGALKDENKWVRRNAIASLGRIGDRSVSGILRRLLGVSDEEIVMAAASALSELGETPEMSWYDPIFASRTHTNASSTAIWAVRETWGEEALPYLASKLDLDNPGRKNMLNYTLVWQIAVISGKDFSYSHDFEDDGTPADHAKNLATMKAILAEYPLK